MGTNYCLYPKARCECCEREFDEIHIGKSSGGWCFSLHVYPEDGINTLEDWQSLWNAPGAYIEDEYSTKISNNEMEKIITERSWGTTTKDLGWYEENGAEPGPFSLARHKIDGHHCVGHGPGTYDFMVGDFS